MQGYELPVGRVFMAEVFDASELRCLFYLSRNDATAVDLITKLNAGVIDEVSVGIIPQQCCCSECGFDFLGADATIDNLWDRTCPEGHVLGVDGVHAKLNGMNKFMELSLVSLGAAKNAKIVGRTQSRLGADEYSRLAASGRNPDITALFATTGKVTPRPTTPTGGQPMAEASLGADAILAQITSLSAANAVSGVQLAAATADNVALKAQITEAQAALTAANLKVTEAEGKLAAAAEGLKLAEEHKSVVAFLSESCRATMVASGTAAPTVPTDVPGILAALEASKVKLHQLPSGQQASGAAGLSATPGGFLPPSAFTVRK
jgi:hypothetical protein